MTQLWMKGNTLPRNLKPENILIKNLENKRPKAYVADLGKFFEKNSIDFKDDKSTFWMAPEILALADSQMSSSECSIDYSKCDIFSIGLIALYSIDHNRFMSYQDKDKQNKLNICPDALKNYLSILATEIPHSFFEKIRSDLLTVLS